LKKHIAIGLFSAVLAIGGPTACTSPELADGYQFGDLSRLTARQLSKLHDARVAYCDETSSWPLKRLAIAIIQTHLPGYPEQGICTDLQRLLQLEQDAPTAKARGDP
jgi:hypothetical protein